MGPRAAVNAVHYNRIQAVPEGPERDALVQQLRSEYETDIDLEKLASELVVDAVIPFDTLRSEVASRLRLARDKPRPERRGPWLAPM
jgi:acetyl-CoA carboxylase carboxyltransferase component